jgi:hypothetical protein
MNGCILAFGPDFKFEEAQALTEMGDFFGKGVMNYGSWLLSSFVKENLLTKERVSDLFRLLDRDNSKTLNA